MKVYQIVGWDDHFENNKSRPVEQCSFICLPNKQHGLGFARVMSEPDGSAIYGIWVCIAAACSQQKRRKGWLTCDGTETGRPWTPGDLALKFRRPLSEVVRTLDFLSRPEIGWIEVHTKQDKPTQHPELKLDAPQVTPECRPSDAQVTPECRPGALKEGRKEGNEEKEVPAGAGGVEKAVGKNLPMREFTDAWIVAYEARWGTKYVFQGAKDGSAVSRLLKAGATPAGLMDLARRAWNNPKGFHCKRAFSIAGFASSINEITAELNGTSIAQAFSTVTAETIWNTTNQPRP